MQSSSMGAMSESQNNGVMPDGAAGTSSLMMKSDEGQSYGGAEEEDRKMRSQLSMTADE